MKDNLKSKKILSKFLKICYKAHKGYFYFVAFKCIVSAALVIFNAYSLSILLKYLENNVYKNALLAGAIIVLINFVFYFLNKIIQKNEETSSLKMIEAVNHTISKKLSEVPFHYLEDPYYLDLKERAKFAIENQGTVYKFIRSIAEVIKEVITLVGLAAIMMMFDFKLILILLIALAFNILFLALVMKTQIKFFNELIPINRKYGYYLDTLMDYRNGKDFRMNNIGKLVINNFELFGEKTSIQFNGFFKKLAFSKIATEIVKYCEMFFVYFFVFIKVVSQKMPVSTFSLYVSTALSFSKTMSDLISTGLEFIQSINYITPFVELMDLEEEKDLGKKIVLGKEIETIEFNNVSFSYPKSKDLILSNISFKINKGEKISIVGLNGAGKTTLIKLLCRLYKPIEGDILVNGISIKDYEVKSYLNEISAVFQDYKLFAYSIKENIANGKNVDLELINNVIEKVGLKEKIESLKDGVDSLYTKSFDDGGIELSGGESQKVAIARSLYRNSSLIVLDEPTASLDPLAEAEIYERFNDLILNKTAIYISHRMSSSIFCDKILVVENGKVVDYDSHKNLINKKEGLYCKLFNMQATQYKLN